MKSTQEIIEELNELRASLQTDSDQPLKMDDVLHRALGRIVDLANLVKTIEENVPHKCSRKEVAKFLKIKSRVSN
jgi:hypothetical protein